MSLNTTVATSNLKAHMRLAYVALSVRAVRRSANPGLWGFQEIGGSGKATCIQMVLGRGKKLVRRKGDAQECPIAYDKKRYVLDHVMVWHLSDPDKVGSGGAGPSTLRAKGAMVLILWDKKKHCRVAVVNAHLAPSPWLNEARSALHTEQVKRLAALAYWLKSHFHDIKMFFVGDWNTTERKRLLPLERAGLNIGPDLATHGPHALDRIASNVGDRHDAHTVLTKSDHRTLVVKY